MVTVVAPLLLLRISIYQGDDTPSPLADAAMMASAPARPMLPISNPKNSSTDTKLEIANLGHCLTVTSSFIAIAHYPELIANSSDIKIFINDVEVTHPDLFNDGRFMIHGIDGFIAPLSPLSCSHGEPHPAFTPKLAITGASAFPDR